MAQQVSTCAKAAFWSSAGAPARVAANEPRVRKVGSVWSRSTNGRSLSTLLPDLVIPGAVEGDGQVLHADVPASHWCVDFTDLKDFGELVLQALREGVIWPTSDGDDFDPADVDIGPSMNVVCEQFVKPVTRRAGGMSWALMMHPQGQPCDLFITHCWREGVFELVSKVLHSWPCGARGAYCCVLSNPQCLDIGSLLGDPRNSPFAVALQSSTNLLVVPNSTCSPYSRVWCVYEAFLAYSWDKAIYTASAPIRRRWAHPLGVCLAVAAGASVTVPAWAFAAPGDALVAYRALIMATVVSYASIFAPSSERAILMYYICGGLAGVSACFNIALVIRGYAPDSPMLAVMPPSAWVVYIFFGFASVAACAYDWKRERQLCLESVHLRKEFTGSFHDAQASEPMDRERIMADIEASGNLKYVNQAVEVLLRAGMSTPSLRAATARGGDVRGAACWSLGHVLAILLSWVVIPLANVVLDDSCAGQWRFVPGLKAAEGLAWLVIFATKQLDQRSFLTTTACKLAVVPYMLVFVLWISAALLLQLPMDHRNCVPDALSAFVLGPCMLALAVAGVAGTARLPVIGPHIITFALAWGRGTHPPPAALEQVESV